MGSPAVDPFLVAFDEQGGSKSGSRAGERALVALVVAVQLGWLTALAYGIHLLV